MNEHEAERIAAAMNQLRPDWPVKQLRTLLRDPGLVHRPRRDVTVALAWVACETRSANPYRVLEAGPWWRAVAVDADTASDRLAWPDDAHRCRTCSLSKADCRRLWTDDDHPYEPASQVIRGHQDMHAIVEGLRNAKLDPVADPPAREKSTAGTTHVQPLREALAAAKPDTEGVASDPVETPTEGQTP